MLNVVTVLIILSVSLSSTRAFNDSDSHCHTWSFYNDTLRDCQCYNSPSLSLHSSSTYRDFVVQCSEDKVLMNAVFCMTIEESGTFVGDCSVYSSNTNASLIDGMYLKLPNNISELNDYMCGPMNRKGRICSECIDGFAPSVTSIGYICSNCTGAWYGVPLYLLLEFVSITLFYILVLVCQISVTSSPLTYCVMYSQLVVFAFSVYPLTKFKMSSKEITIVKILLTLHGIWNLDFFLYILPPFCVSQNIKFFHVVLLKYISAIYPVLLIVLTWLVIEMHSRNFKLIVWLWDKINCSFRMERQSKFTIIDIFATFFLLSYTKLCFTSMIFVWQTNIYNANDGRYYKYTFIDPNIVFFSKEHIPYVVIAALMLLIFGVLPALLLAVYPIRILRSLLLINRLSGRSKVALDIFVEKFYSCYRDGLDGGKDMRSFASFHLIIRLLCPLVCKFLLSMGTVFLIVWCVIIFVFRPCKKRYVNNIDAFILAALALFSIQIDKINGNSIYSDVHIWSMLFIMCLQCFITYGNLIPSKYLLKVNKYWISSTKILICKDCIIRKHNMRERRLSESDSLLQDSHCKLISKH